MRQSATLLSRRAVAAGIGTVLAGAPTRRAAAAAKITLGYTATIGFNAAFIAKDRGIFARHGLDVELLLITLNSNIPGALVGGSIQIGGPTPTVLLQANDGGLDLVVIAGCSAVDPNNQTDGLLVRKDLAIGKPSDLIGKKIGVPGLNAYFHILVRKWLNENGVDWRKVNFVEVPFTQSADVLRSGSIDAVATGEPFSTRILSEGIGTLMMPAYVAAPAGTSTIFYATTRDWAKANPEAVHGFGAAIEDAVRLQATDPAGARASAGKFIKLPPAVMASMSLPVLQSVPKPEQIGFWIDVMAQQGMIQDKPDPTKLIVR